MRLWEGHADGVLRPDTAERESIRAATAAPRPVVAGKFLFVGGTKFYARGVTYGPFRPEADGCVYHTPEIVRRDFAAMAAQGINSVRTYTCPPRWLLDVAGENGLRVMAGVGLVGEQLSAFLDDRKTARDVRRHCVSDARACTGHPALLAYAIGNEIPSTIVRWHGRRRVERFLNDLYNVAHEHDPDALVTYVNYPSSEYLQLPFLDFFSYNVYLESRERLDAYLARLQNIADYKPLVMTELGLDSMRNGPEEQAKSLHWQIRSAFAAGCAGAFVFSWTDEWHTGGSAIENWKFGITDHERRPKPALEPVRRAFADAPLPITPDLPPVSVVVCTYNGSRTLRDCLQGCAKIDYPNFEVIVVNDGSTDGSADIARQFEVRLINTENGGLSRARNLGMNAATGEILAYLDDDARPDPHWLRYLVETFRTSEHAAVGGPNIVPPTDPPFAQCVAHSPGGPTHVLLTDRLAEHIPGCNMAFRTARLREIGGFDPQFRIAGDDVDVCWRLQARGWTLGFSPAAVVWHHRRSSLRAYWKQQLNYGRAEAMLELKWPEKYNSIGHVGWRGRLYGTGSCRGIGWMSSRIYHGVWASNAFQPMCPETSTPAALPLMPEWYLIIASLTILGALGALWPVLWISLVLAAMAAMATAVQAARSALRAPFENLAGRGLAERAKLRTVTAALHVLQPIARLWGRLSYGLTPWRRQTQPQSLRCFAWPRPRTSKIWSETWQSAEQRLGALEAFLREQRMAVRRGGVFDDWDLEVRGGFFTCLRIRLALEEFPGGRQFVCFRSWPCLIKPACAAGALLVILAVAAGLEHAHLVVTGALGALACVVIVRALGDCGADTRSYLNALARYDAQVRGVAVADAMLHSPAKESDAQPVPVRQPAHLPQSHKHPNEAANNDDDALEVPVCEVL